MSPPALLGPLGLGLSGPRGARRTSLLPHLSDPAEPA